MAHEDVRLGLRAAGSIKIGILEGLKQGKVLERLLG